MCTKPIELYEPPIGDSLKNWLSFRLTDEMMVQRGMVSFVVLRS